MGFYSQTGYFTKHIISLTKFVTYVFENNKSFVQNCLQNVATSSAKAAV